MEKYKFLRNIKHKINQIVACFMSMCIELYDQKRVLHNIKSHSCRLLRDLGILQW